MKTKKQIQSWKALNLFFLSLLFFSFYSFSSIAVCLSVELSVLFQSSAIYMSAELPVLFQSSAIYMSAELSVLFQSSAIYMSAELSVLFQSSAIYMSAELPVLFQSSAVTNNAALNLPCRAGVRKYSKSIHPLRFWGSQHAGVEPFKDDACPGRVVVLW